MICKNCGNDKFYAMQALDATVVVDENGEFYRNLDSGLENAVMSAERPRGPYTCTRCGQVYQSDADSIITVCCNQKLIWQSREEAMAYFADHIRNSYGAERNNYVKVYTALQQGLKYCSDSKEIQNAWR